MGAETFRTMVRGASAEEAFNAAVAQAHYDYGHRGYTGTIAEKDSFVVIPLPQDQDPDLYAERLIDDFDPRIDDKWGPAGCFELGNGYYLFFGWASC